MNQDYREFATNCGGKNKYISFKKRLDGKMLKPIHCLETYIKFLNFKQHLVLTKNESVSL